VSGGPALRCLPRSWHGPVQQTPQRGAQHPWQPARGSPGSIRPAPRQCHQSTPCDRATAPSRHQTACRAAGVGGRGRSGWVLQCRCHRCRCDMLRLPCRRGTAPSCPALPRRAPEAVGGGAVDGGHHCDALGCQVLDHGHDLRQQQAARHATGERGRPALWARLWVRQFVSRVSSQAWVQAAWLPHLIGCAGVQAAGGLVQEQHARVAAGAGRGGGERARMRRVGGISTWVAGKAAAGPPQGRACTHQPAAGGWRSWRAAGTALLTQQQLT
jgi:hypothetical protein